MWCKPGRVSYLFYRAHKLEFGGTWHHGPVQRFSREWRPRIWRHQGSTELGMWHVLPGVWCQATLVMILIMLWLLIVFLTRSQWYMNCQNTWLKITGCSEMSLSAISWSDCHATMWLLQLRKAWFGVMLPLFNRDGKQAESQSSWKDIDIVDIYTCHIQIHEFCMGVIYHDLAVHAATFVST